MKQYTSIEQSKKLLELGLDHNTADMYYSNEAEYIGKIEYNEYPCVWSDGYELSKTDLPCWSAGALLIVIGNYSMYGTLMEDRRHTCIASNGRWLYATELIDTCYNMVVWLLENVDDYRQFIIHDYHD